MAGFTFAEDPMAWPTTFEFISEVSDDVIAYWWEFGDGATSVEADPTHRYLSSFEKEVIQVVANQYDCLDTATAVIDLDQLKGLFIPNVLEPENRMVEEKRYFHPQGIGLEEYHIAIYARNGELVWESSEVDAEGMPSARWDGTFRGKPLQGGTFVWKVHRARFADGSEWQGMVDERRELRRSGFVYLVR
jgi:PKD repeat protein